MSSSYNNFSGPLNASGVFTGQYESLTNISTVITTIKSDKNGTLRILFSSTFNNNSYDSENIVDVIANTPSTTISPGGFGFFKIIFTNGNTAATNVIVQNNFISGFSSGSDVNLTNNHMVIDSGTIDVKVRDSDGNSITSTNLGLNTYCANQISGFATETTTGNIKTQTDKLTFNASRLLCDVSGQSVNVGNFPASQSVTGTLTTKLQDNSGNPLNSTSGSLNVHVDNQPTALNVNVRDSAGNSITSTNLGLNVNCINQISGFATETTTNAIKTQTDKLTFNTTRLMCDVSGQSVNISNFPASQPVYDASNNTLLNTFYTDVGVGMGTTNTLLGKNNYDASMNLLVMPARTTPANYGCFYFSVTSAVGGGSFSPVFCDTSTFTLAGTGSPGLYSVGALSYIPKGASVTIGLTHASQGSVNHQLCPAASDASGNYTTNGYAIGGLNTYSSAYQVTQCGKWTYPNGVPRYIGFYNNSSGGSISGVKVSISFVY